MSYSNQTTYGRKIIKNNTKMLKQHEKRLLISWGVCILIGLIIGALGTWGINSLVSAAVNDVESITNPYEINITYSESPVYGTIDDKVFDDEISLDWSSGAELGFVPLDVPMDEDLQEYIYCLSYAYNIDFPFVMALINQESAFTVNVTSGTNDFGLMQINEINHEWLTATLGVTDFQDPYQNTRCGIYILRKLFEKHEDPAKVLMAYNMGERGAGRLWEQGIFETNYSNKIMAKSAEYTDYISEMKDGESNEAD